MTVNSPSNKDQEAQRKGMIKNTFETVATGYGKGGARFFHGAGEFMARLHNLNGDEHVLDVACGTGAAAIPLAKALPQGKVTAVDFSPSMLAQARARAQQEGLENIHFETQDMTAMSLEDGGFDHANCAFGLFFVEDMQGLLSHISSKVKPGGQVLVSGFCGESFMPAAELVLNRLADYGVEVPEQRFGWKRMAEPEQLEELFDSAGLKHLIITRKSLGYYTDEEGWWEVVWNAGFRGLVEQVGDQLEKFKREHFEEICQLKDERGLWLEIDVNFTSGTSTA